MWNAYPDIVQRVIDNKLDDIDFSKTFNIKQARFEVIKQKIVDNYALAELIQEFKGLLSMPVIRQIYNKYASVQAVREALKEDPYKCLCQLSGVGFKTADSILQEFEKEKIINYDYDLKTSKQRCLACIMHLLETNETEGHTRMNIVELRNQVMKLTPACSNLFVESLKSSEIYYDKDKMIVSLRSTYETEKYIADKIKEALNTKNVWNVDTSKYKIVNGCELSEEQQSVTPMVCNNQISILNGSGGCVDCDTEYFNGTQWKKISEYNENDFVLQYNKDGTANLVKPIEYIKQPTSTLYHFETKYGLDQCLSLNHTVVYITSKGNLYKKSFDQVKNDQETNGFHGKFITTFNYNGTGIDLSDNKIRLMIAIFADGHFQNSGIRCVMNLKKQRKKDRLEELLKLNNIIYKKSESSIKGYHRYWFDAPFHCKTYPKEWYNCSKHQLEVIANEVMNWDGCYTSKNTFTTTNKSDADFIQFVFTSLGYKTTIRTLNRVGNEYITNNKTYIRKSIEYDVSYTNRNLVSMCYDKRTPHANTKINEYKPKDGLEYCFVVPSHMLVLRRNDKIFITGNCGKSFTTQSVINMCKDNNKTFGLMSPTGRAAKVLADYTKESASTIHRGLDFNPGNPEHDGWGFNEENKLMWDIVIVDEFSMADIFLFKHLLEAIDFNKTKLLLVGDNAQLPSVGAGNLLHDFMESKKIPTVTLTKVFRYGEGGISKIATDIRNCVKYLVNIINPFTYFGKNKDYAFLNVDDSVIVKNALALYKKVCSKEYQELHGLKLKVSDVQVLTSKNVGDCGTDSLNNELQKIANPNYGSKEFMKIGDRLFFKDDLVMQTKNNYHAELYTDNVELPWDDFELNSKRKKEVMIANGETGTIIEINIKEQYVIIDFDGVKVKYYRGDLQSVSLGYAITIHKSQGGSIPIVILLTPKSHTFMLNSNLLYVGVSRTKVACYHLGNKNTINQCVNKKANFVRNTFMQELLN